MNLNLKIKKLSIPFKIFLFLSLLTYFIIFFSLIAGYLYLEKYQISQRKNVLINLANKYKQIPKDKFEKFLEEEGIFFKKDTISNLNSLKQTTTTFLKTFVSENSAIGIVRGRDQIKRIILIKKTGENKVIILGSPLASLRSTANISFKFYLFLFLGSIPFNLILAYFLSIKMGRPIEKELLILNENLKEELKKEKKLDEFRKKFISNISHELKTPISIISGYSDAIIDGIIEEDDIVNICKNINLEASNMNNLIKDLLFFTKLESQYIKLESENINLKEFLNSNLSRYSLDFQSKNIHLFLHLKDITINTDKKLFTIAINNILTNAISYVNEKNIIEVKVTNSSLIIKNSFTNKENINLNDYFLPFNGKKSSPNQKYGGTGLGLSIVSQILNILKFKYDFSFNEKEKNIEFTIYF